MKFVDRVKEIARLQRALTTDERKLIVIYGRRRVGKSALIRRVMTDEDVYFQADETQMANQLWLLAKAIGMTFPGFERAVYPDWYALLEALNYRITAPVTLCLDEFPYLVKSCPSLPSILQRFWDTASPRFNLILCGSSQQSMYAEVLNEKSPLYGRADGIIKLQPISVTYLQEAMGLTTAREAIEHYAFWGGVPRYWKMAAAEENLQSAVRQLLLSADGTLADEPNRLLRDEMRDLMLSRSLLSTIGNGVNRMSEIAARLGKNASELAGPMKRLLDMGMIEKDIPFGESEKNSKRTLYRISDPFMDAYYHFVAPNASLIAMGREQTVCKMVEDGLNSYVGNHWERLCRRAVSGGMIDGINYGLASRWWGSAFDKSTGQGRMMELDVVAESTCHKHLFVGECKWTSAEHADRLLAELEAKVTQLPFAKEYEQIHLALFLKEAPLTSASCTMLYPKDIVEMMK